MTCEYVAGPSDLAGGGHHERIDDDRNEAERSGALR
jgi:hypothetical protein